MKLEVILKAIDEKKAEDIYVYEFNQLNPSVDHVIICSGSSIRQVHAIADNIKDRLKEHGLDMRSVEGDKDSMWMLVDAYDIVVHVFQNEERKRYGLEKLYANLKVGVYGYDV